MADHDPKLVRSLIRTAKIRAAELGGAATIRSVLEGLLITQFNLTIKNGRTVISTAEAGGSTTFVLSEGLTPSEYLTLVEACIEELDNHTDPNNPDLNPRQIKRLRVTFKHATF